MSGPMKTRERGGLKGPAGLHPTSVSTSPGQSRTHASSLLSRLDVSTFSYDGPNQVSFSQQLGTNNIFLAFIF